MGKLILFIVVTVMLLSAFTLFADNEDIMMSNVTGSIVKNKTTWLGLFSDSQREESPLGQWSRQHDLSVREMDVMICRNTGGLLGSCRLYGRPAVFEMRNWQELFVGKDDETNIRQFIYDMKKADEPARKIIVAAAVKRMEKFLP
jgi:hypothetical protein